MSRNKRNLDSSSAKNSIRPDWLLKTFAGLLAGLGLALAISGYFVLITPDIEGDTQVQLAMWMIMPVWLLVLSGCYLFHSGLRAWLWLGLANLILWSPLLVLRGY